ncbi:MAG: peroxide stress protein YaaA [Mariprofundaceae bacterium]|nr:peroxide stress protein YaaA [Mariprofundaceae bacterium]
MLIVISPAKKLDMDTVTPFSDHSQPELLEHAGNLIDILRNKDSFDIAEMMKLSMPLADLNVARYQAWHLPFSLNNAKQALWAFRGDVYQSMGVDSLSTDDTAFAQKHLRILSGLYGLLRPLDLMQAYRLEMGTKLRNPQGNDLYTFWGNIITEHLNMALAQQGDQILLNLASQEYFKSVRSNMLKGKIITPVFKELKNGQYKVIGIYAKRARGLMSRYIIQHRLNKPDELRQFDKDGYSYNPELSKPQQPVFTR